MTQSLDPVQTSNVEQYTDINQLTHFWAQDGLPVFVSDVDDLLDIVANLGFSIFYVLGNVKETSSSASTTSTTTTSTAKPATVTTTYAPKETFRAQIFKVVNNIIGQSITPVKDVALESFDLYKQEAFYNMPPIPRIIIDKLDEFFRTVDATYGTESIVLLTFDTSKNDSSGWGVLVPDQENTSAHCSYDPLSVAESKPDNVLIVGSVHSHPQMSAYASGTDHKDQADFDGLHITFGWQDSVNNGATQYHIEMQMSGSTYTLKPKDVFEPYTLSKEPDPEVLEWAGKVKKALPPNSWGVTHTAALTRTPPAVNPTNQNHPTQSSNQKTTELYDRLYHEIRPELSIQSCGVVIAELSPLFDGNNVEYFCPCCDSVLDHDDIWAGYCWSCDIPICSKNETIANIHDIIYNYCIPRNILPKDHDIYLWGMNSGTNEEFFISIQTAQNSLNSNDPQDAIYEKYDQTTYDKYLDFEADTRYIDVYEPKSICNSCTNFYAYSCPPYRELAVNHDSSIHLDVLKYSNSINPVECEYFHSYNYSRDEYYEETIY